MDRSKMSAIHTASMISLAGRLRPRRRSKGTNAKTCIVVGESITSTANNASFADSSGRKRPTNVPKMIGNSWKNSA